MYVCLYVPKYLEKYRTYSFKTNTQNSVKFPTRSFGLFIYERGSPQLCLKLLEEYNLRL